MVGFNVGNIYDTLMRAVARAIGKHIPKSNRHSGQPAGRRESCCRKPVFNASPRDGTVTRLQPQHPDRATARQQRDGQIRRHQIHLDRQCRQ